MFLFQRYKINLPEPQGDLPSFANTIKPTVFSSLLDEFDKRGPFKVQFVISPLFEKMNETDDDSKDYANPSMRSYQKIVMTPTDIPQVFQDSLDKIEDTIDSYTEMGSGWSISGISNAAMSVSTYAPVETGSSYIPLPKWLASKRAIVNVNNGKANDCIRWAIKSALFPVAKDPQRTSKYPNHDTDGLDFKGFKYPFKIKDIPELELRNNLALNLYCPDEYSQVGKQRIRDGKPPRLIQIHYSKMTEYRKMIDLIVFEGHPQGDKKVRKTSHYAWIKNPSRLFPNLTKNHNQTIRCPKCLISKFTKHEDLQIHLENCMGPDQSITVTKMPKEDRKIVKFTQYQNKLPCQIVVYADFECVNKKVDHVDNNPAVSSTTTVQVQEACAYYLLALKSDGSVLKTSSHLGPDTVSKFVQELKDVEKLANEITKEKIKMTGQDWQNYKAAKVCHICMKDFVLKENKQANKEGNKEANKKADSCVNNQANQEGNKKDNTKKSKQANKQADSSVNKQANQKSDKQCSLYVGGKVRDHDHISGEYRGAAHYTCNLNLRITNADKIPVFFHNLRGYDAHLLMKEIHQISNKIHCIPDTPERYKSFSVGRFEFKDSQQFLLLSLAALAKSEIASVGMSGLRYMNELALQGMSLSGRLSKEELLNIHAGKGVYPYDAMDSFEALKRDSFPSREECYNSMTKSEISDQDYNHAIQVWESFECNTMEDYCRLYCRTDVLLLADIFENYRKTALEVYGLDPARHYTSPGLSFPAFLLHSDAKLELLTDESMLTFFEDGTRGGISTAMGRYARANNPMVPGYKPDKPTTWLLYLDENNLYGWAMMQYLPKDSFKWLSTEEIQQAGGLEGILATPPDSNTGYALDVEIEYPKSLHDEHSDLPMAPESVKTEIDWLSPYQRYLLRKSGRKTIDSTHKLTPNLYDKKNYICHYRTLAFYKKHGLSVTKVSRVLSFHQEPFMKSYIEKNTKMRAESPYDSAKNLFKLMNNAIYGKTMENVRKRIEYKLVAADDTEKLRKLFADPRYVEVDCFNDNLFGVKMNKKDVYMNKPIAIGFAVLELSKLLMYEFYYDYFKKKYPGNLSRLLYMDTDSFILEVQTEDVYRDMEKDVHLYDTSGYDKKHPLYSPTNKKVPGLMKDELNGKPMEEYIGLRSKMYHVQKADGSAEMKAKGVSKATIKSQIRRAHFLESLWEDKSFRHEMKRLVSKDHTILMQSVNKISLSPLDTKRWLAADRTSTLAFGHYRIPEREQQESKLLVS